MEIISHFPCDDTSTMQVTDRGVHARGRKPAMNNSETTTIVVMKCGHRANGDSNGAECCVGCAIDSNRLAFERADALPNLEGRFAVCTYGGHGRSPSSFALAYFQHMPGRPTDQYYCGCYGWD